jgi:hypothetical protein
MERIQNEKIMGETQTHKDCKVLMSPNKNYWEVTDSKMISYAT